MSDYSIYPNTIDGYAQLPVAVDGTTEINAFSVNTLRSAIYNIEVELGVLPSGSNPTVAARLDVVQTALDAVEEAVSVLEDTVITQGLLDAHTENTSNPHGTSVSNLESGTLSDLNTIITDATLDDSSSARPPLNHASTHISGGEDEIDGDNLAISYEASNYTDGETLQAHLVGVDSKIAEILVDEALLESVAGKFTSRLDTIIFQLGIITGVELEPNDDPIGKLDDIITLFSIMTEVD